MPAYQTTPDEHDFDQNNKTNNAINIAVSNSNAFKGTSTTYLTDSYWNKVIRDIKTRDLDLRTLEIQCVRLTAAYIRLIEADSEDDNLIDSLNMRINNLVADIRWILNQRS